jgi:uncharacterized protein (TIGR03437 family)
MTTRRTAALLLGALLAACSSDPSGPGRPDIASLSREAVAAGDTLVITGSGFAPGSAGTLVFVGGSRAMLARATTTTLAIVVPPCLTHGAVEVVVEVSGTRSDPATVDYTASVFEPRLGLYEGTTIAGGAEGQCIQLEGDGARYLLVPQFATADETASLVRYVLGVASGPVVQAAPADAAPAAGRDAALRSRFDRALRAYERRMPKSPPRRAGARADRAALAAAPPPEGSTRDFRVLCSLDVDQECFTTVTGRLRFVGAHVLLYVDEGVPTGGFTDAELRSFGAHFDDTLYPLDVQLFGGESDIDDNGRVMMLLTPVVNQLTPRTPCNGGTILGFFFGYDLTGGGDSNEGEIFYGLVPDPNGEAACRITKAQVQRALPSTFIHEFQHMINYNHHVLEGGGEQEADWLNEGMSHIAEEQGGRHYEWLCTAQGIGCPTDPAQLFPDSAQGFVEEQLQNSYDYLFNTASTSVTLYRTGDCCEGRGAAWLFLRYVGDRFDSTVYARLAQSRLTSTANVEQATAVTFESLFGDFGIALYADSVPGAPRDAIPARYRFASRNLRQLYRRLSQIDPTHYPIAFPLRPQPLGVGGPVEGFMMPGTSAYHLLATADDSGPVTIRFSDRGGTPFRPSLRAQLGIFRVR